MDETFTKPALNTYASSSGFTVKVLGRTGLLYSEGERSIHIDSEVLAGEPPGIWVTQNTGFEWQPSDGRPVSDAERDRILGNIKRAFGFFGHRLEVTEAEGFGAGWPTVTEIVQKMNRDT